MRRRYWGSAVVAAVLVGAAGVAPAIAESPALGARDAAFMRSVHQGNLAEIAAGRDAQRHAVSGCVRRVGRVLVRDHGRLDAQGAVLADELGLALPAGPTAEQRSDLMALQGDAGTRAYDRAWLRGQETAHEETLALIDAEIKNGRNPQVQAAAKDARPVVARHLEMVRGGRCRG